MKIIESDEYKIRLREVTSFIKNDKKSAAINFAKELRENIRNLNNYPFKFRKSIYFDDDNIRDMIYKGYTITYEINGQNETIEILDIFNQNKR
ncbi:MAG: type II toxin-antitoxin system RelE/ParE family toxin [Campylobacterota bacterium]|nr:type II toxin-antitoxin system RelE/ParE family toxin [Campylobacterota bacterium]